MNPAIVPGVTRPAIPLLAGMQRAADYRFAEGGYMVMSLAVDYFPSGGGGRLRLRLSSSLKNSSSWGFWSSRSTWRICSRV